MVPNSVLRGEFTRPDGKPVSHAARVLYGLILHYSWCGDRDCRAPKTTLATDLGMSPRHVTTLLRELREARMISGRRTPRGETDAIAPLVLPERNPASGDDRNPASAIEEPPAKNNIGVGTKDERRSNNERENARG